jgi:D-3-phosphoglycerate dehydrogenase
VNEAFLTALLSVRAIVRYGVGYDNVDIEACSIRGVKVSNVTGYADHSVSNHALALIFSCARSLKAGISGRRDQFGTPPRVDILDLHDKTLGVVGFGNIGRTLCAKSADLFGRIFAVDPYVSEDIFTRFGAERVTFETLLEESDVISLHCTLTPETRHILNGDAFAAMKRRPIIINTARGGVIDFQAMSDALSGGRIHSIGVDVFPREPPDAIWNELLESPNVTATGHYAWYSVSASRELQRRAGENLASLLIGKTPRDCLNP